MSITLAQVEYLLVDTLAVALRAVRITATALTDPTPRAYLGSQIGYAVREQGYLTADPTQPTDLEVQAVPDTDRLRDIAELLMLEKVVRLCDQVDWQSTTEKQSWDQFPKRMTEQRNDRRDFCARVYGFGRGKIGLATIDLGFNAKMPRFDGDDDRFGF